MRWLLLFHRDRYKVHKINMLNCLFRPQPSSISKQTNKYRQEHASIICNITSIIKQAPSRAFRHHPSASTIKQAPSHSCHQKYMHPLQRHSISSSVLHTHTQTTNLFLITMPVSRFLEIKVLRQFTELLTTIDIGDKKMQVKYSIQFIIITMVK